MSDTARIVLVAIGASLILGIAIAGFVLLSSQFSPSLGLQHSSGSELLYLIARVVVISLLFATPSGLAGGIVASRVYANKRDDRNLPYWLLRGGLWGGMVGASVGILLLLVPTILDATKFSMMVGISKLFGFSGAAVGLVVGLYCAHLADDAAKSKLGAVDLPPNRPVNPTAGPSRSWRAEPR